MTTQNSQPARNPCSFKPGDWVKDVVTGRVGKALRWGFSDYMTVDFDLDDTFLTLPLQEQRTTTPMPGEVRAAKKRLNDGD